MANTRTRTRLHMGCGETLSGRLVSAPETRNTDKLIKAVSNDKRSSDKPRRVINK